MLNYLKNLDYYKHGIDNTFACYSTNLLISIICINLFINSLKNKNFKINLRTFRIFLLLHALTHILAVFYHIFIGKNERVNDKFDCNENHNLKKTTRLWTKITSFDTISTLILNLSVMSKIFNNNLYHDMGLFIVIIIYTLRIIHSNTFFNGVINGPIHFFINLSKYISLFIFGYIRKDKKIIVASLIGFFTEFFYLVYRLKFPKSIEDKKNSYFPKQGFLPKAFNHNAFYHVGLTYFIFKIYKSLETN